MMIEVPGRICLFGEHSDWAGGYRRVNAEIEPGLAIITGTNQAIHAEVRTHPSRLIVCATLEDGTRMQPFSVPMERPALLQVAQTGGFYSYAAGVAYQVLTHYRVRGLEIDNTRTDLPVKKGLSSSAAVCVLVARAFNRLYDLKLTVRGEMELAYLGEITTPSRCGRLDQGCAFGQRPVLMAFDGDRMDVQELSVGRDVHMIIVDLRAAKDTREILNRLNHCYPFAENDIQRGVQHFLGPVNRDLTRRAVAALRDGDAARLGALMREAQAGFDRHVQPACPSQLRAPVLHKLLAYASLQPWILGGKGVGSQGDGAAQLIARDAAAQAEAMRIIRDELDLHCLPLVLRSGQRVRKAVIPAAGFGTRLFPATKAVKKELFPIVDATGRAKPVILAIVEEAIEAGIEEICILVQTGEKEHFESIFASPPPLAHYQKLAGDDQRYADRLLAIGQRITFICQDHQEGFGHAVLCARAWVGGEPFLLMLGDHLYASHIERNCARQVIDTFEETQTSVVGLMVTPGREIHHYGCVGGTWRRPGHRLAIDRFLEKPALALAREQLAVETLARDSFLALFGLYVLKPAIFEYLAESVAHNVRHGGEFQLTPCLDRLRREDAFAGEVIQGRRFDIGNPAAYRKTLLDFARTSPTRKTNA